MEAPHVVTFRALIMLASLVVLPLVAVFGLPVDQNVLDLIPDQYRGLLTRAMPKPVATEPVLEVPGETLRYQAVPAIQTRPLVSPLTDSIHQASYDSASEVQGTPVGTAGSEMPRLMPVSMSGGSAESNAPEAIGNRLRELGAIRYTLEPWGTSGKVFRFRADVAIGQDPNFHRHFEAVDVDKLAAMQQVLAQVENWRSRR